MNLPQSNPSSVILICVAIVIAVVVCGAMRSGAVHKASVMDSVYTRVAGP